MRLDINEDPVLFIGHDAALQVLWDSIPRPKQFEKYGKYVGTLMCIAQTASSIQFARMRLEAMRRGGEPLV